MTRTLSPFRLDGKTALVTGALRGIGAATAELLAQAGAHVIVTGRRDDAGEKMAADLCDKGHAATFIHLDVREESQWQRAFEQTIAKTGRLDVLVHNAGAILAKSIVETSSEEIRELMAINVDGVIIGTKLAMQAMHPAGAAGLGGSIVIIGSVAGVIGAPNQAVYGASKGAVRAFTRGAAVEAAQFGFNVRVNAVLPGTIETDMTNNAIDEVVKSSGGLFPNREAALQYIISKHPLGRLGESIDIANAVLFLASDASKWVTGAELSVDGGLTAA